MADASIIDIGGVQWNVKDKEARERVTALEKKTSANFDYSLDEKEIGTWLNGEKLYRLVITGSTTVSPTFIHLNDKNIKNITSIKGVYTTNKNDVYQFNTYIPVNAQNLSKYFASMGFSDSDKKIFMSFGIDDMYKNVSYILQFEYTKNE